MSCRRHRTWHPTLSLYTDTERTCRCAIHWCGTTCAKYLVENCACNGMELDIWSSYMCSVYMLKTLLWYEFVDNMTRGIFPVNDTHQFYFCASVLIKFRFYIFKKEKNVEIHQVFIYLLLPCLLICLFLWVYKFLPLFIKYKWNRPSEDFESCWDFRIWLMRV